MQERKIIFTAESQGHRENPKYFAIVVLCVSVVMGVA
jgi:hypothetical protein